MSGCSSAGRVQASQAWCRGFDPRHPLHSKLLLLTGVDLWVHFFFDGDQTMSAQETRTRLSELAKTSCRIQGVELWGLEYFPGPGGKKGIVRIYIDSEDGVSIEQCAELSRNLSVVLDVEDIIPGAYALEVSSPGLNRLFFSPAQMEGFAGHKVKVSLRQARQGRKNFSGILHKVEGSKIFVNSDSQDHWSFDWEDIDKARLVA